MNPSSLLVAAAAALVLALGLIHLLYTFHGPKLTPRAVGLRAAMEATSPRISSATTMWRAWVGFNASHSLGAILFGLVYGYLACTLPEVLFASRFLCALGMGVLLSYATLGWFYWFSVPFAGVVISALLFAAGIAGRFGTGGP